MSWGTPIAVPLLPPACALLPMATPFEPLTMDAVVAPSTAMVVGIDVPPLDCCSAWICWLIDVYSLTSVLTPELMLAYAPLNDVTLVSNAENAPPTVAYDAPWMV